MGPNVAAWYRTMASALPHILHVCKCSFSLAPVLGKNYDQYADLEGLHGNSPALGKSASHENQFTN